MSVLLFVGAAVALGVYSLSTNPAAVAAGGVAVWVFILSGCWRLLNAGEIEP